MSPAEKLLFDHGIADPKDIDVEAIAYCVNAEVDYRSLSSCEAQIIGFRERAVIYVSKDLSFTRKRFSVGHELGHWHHHKGQSFVCRRDDIGRPLEDKSKNVERVADTYSANLLLPPFLVWPKLVKLGDLTLGGIADLAQQFSTSITATAICAMRMTKQPLLLIAHNLYGRKWQWPSVTFGGFRVREDLDPRSSAFSPALSGHRISISKKEPASYWFDRRHIEQFDVRVENIRTVEGETLTLMRALDPAMIEIYT